MVPRSELYAININYTFDEVREQVSASGYDSILLYRDEMSTSSTPMGSLSSKVPGFPSRAYHWPSR